jgi:hypothetical protein
LGYREAEEAKEIDMDNTVLVVPTWVTSTVHFFERNWVAMVGILVIALLSCIVTELAKHKWSVKYEEAKAKTIVRWVLLSVSAGFTALATVIYFMQTNELALRKIPYIGQNEVQVLGAAWMLYNFRLNRTFANIRAKLAKWSDAKLDNKPTLADALSQPEKAPTPPPTEFSI